MKIAELIQQAAEKQGVSVYKIGKMLGYNDSRIYSIVKGSKPLPEKDVFTACEWAEVDPILVFPDLLAQRAKDKKIKKVWEQVVTLVEKGTATAAAVILALGLTISPIESQASADSFNITPSNNIHYAHLIFMEIS